MGFSIKESLAKNASHVNATSGIADTSPKAATIEIIAYGVHANM